MFCPNCGAQNQDTANACTKCGFALKAPGAAPKFKGTMLMMNAPPGQAKPGGPSPAQPPGGPVPGGPPPGVGPFAGAPQPQAAPPAAAPAAAPKPKLKGTMIGVAPPSLGSNVPAAAPPVADVPPPPPHDFGGAGGYGQPQQPQAGFGSTQQAFGGPGAGGAYPPPGGYGAPPPGAPPNAPSSAVNPLGGTVVADASAFTNPAFGNAPPQQPQGGFDPNAQPPGYGAPYNPGAPPQPGYGGFDPGAAPPQFQSPPQGGYGAPQGQYGNPGFNSTEPAGGSYGMSPYGSSPPLEPVRNSNMEIPGTVGGQNPIVTVLLIVCTCGIYGIYLLVKGKKAQG